MDDGMGWCGGGLDGLGWKGVAMGVHGMAIGWGWDGMGMGSVGMG